MDTGRVADPDGLLDTNILIDELRGIPQARIAIDACTSPAISIISWIEVMAGTDASDEAATRAYLSAFPSIPLTPEIAERAAAIRRNSRLKLPDAIILATAQIEGPLLISRNTKDFPAGQVGVHVPYPL